jgi:LacI family transcriptional regulator
MPDAPAPSPRRPSTSDPGPAPKRSPGTRPSLREVAHAAGVAVSSASRVISGHPDVSDEMRQRVLAAVDELGYDQNLLWQSLRSGTTQTIGMIVRDISSQFWAEIALGAEQRLQEAGYSMLLANSRGEVGFDPGGIRLLNQRRVDGMIVAPNDPEDAETVAALGRLRIPIVTVDRELPGHLRAGSVYVDHAAAMHDAARLLMVCGHRRVGFVAPPERLRPTLEGSKGLRAAVEGTTTEVVIMPGPFTVEHGFEATARMLSATDRPTAVICASGQMFPGVLRAIRQMRMRMPDDLSLIAIDDIPLLAEIVPSIAMINRQPGQIGREAASILLDMLDGAEPRTKVVPAVYAPGDTVSAPPSTARS